MGSYKRTINKGNFMKVFFFLSVIFFAQGAFAAISTIEMLNKGEKRSMVFSKEIVNVNVGDTVKWQATDKGHNVEFIFKNGIPKNVEKFKSKVGKDTEYTFNTPGIYAYWCTPHKTMGMIGFIIVGEDLSNLESIKKVKFLGKSKKIAKALIEKIEE